MLGREEENLRDITQLISSHQRFSLATFTYKKLNIVDTDFRGEITIVT